MQTIHRLNGKCQNILFGLKVHHQHKTIKPFTKQITLQLSCLHGKLGLSSVLREKSGCCFISHMDSCQIMFYPIPQAKNMKQPEQFCHIPGHSFFQLGFSLLFCTILQTTGPANNFPPVLPANHCKVLPFSQCGLPSYILYYFSIDVFLLVLLINAQHLCDINPYLPKIMSVRCNMLVITTIIVEGC